MSAWPQIFVIAWLILATGGGLFGAARPRRERIVLSPRHQRLSALFFAAAAAGEASLLWAGGFFKGMI